MVLWTAAGAAAAVTGIVAGALWYVTGRFLTPVDTLPMRTEILSATPSSVTLPRDDTSIRTGTYGLEWEEPRSGETGSAVLGDVLSATSSTVTRELVDGSTPRPGAKARIMVTVWGGDPSQVGLPFSSVEIDSPVGMLPAWLVPADSSTWVIQVHGLGAGRSAGLRMMPALNHLGLPVLAITYRNDPGAPSEGDGNRQLGDTEWHDLDAAVRYAVSHGAREVVLYGFSMGGAIVETYLDRASDTSAVSAVVLDAPVLDYRAAIDHVVGSLRLPRAVGWVEERIVSLRSGVDLSAVDALSSNRRSGGPGQPVLVFHGTGDTLVPLSTSEQLAEEWPEDVTLVVTDGAPHTGSWNIDPEGYERRLTQFLTRDT